MVRKVIRIGEAVHRAFEGIIKGAPVKKKHTLTWEEEEALRLRREQKWLESGNWPHKKATDAGITSEEDRGAEHEDELAPIDIDNEHFLMPLIDQQLSKSGSSLTGRSIMEEIHSDYLSGKMRTFVEGEPIGACNNTPKPGPAPALKTHNEYMDDKQKALHVRQQRNDRTLGRMLERTHEQES